MDTHHRIDLFDALVLVKTSDEARRFMTDLCTPSEIRALAERWKVCQLLNDGFSYREIREETGASLTTIGRVARFLNDEPYNGYKELLNKIRNKENEKVICTVNSFG
ncbi:hypothetical protein FACS1894122_11330 [Alphaproteobacteria bacterium]|nr:hypothetical protein FACS1894122_11330 [Alphaproteobacteria bacterium]